MYKFQVKEATVDSWEAGEKLRVEVYGSGITGAVLFATLYIQQSEADNGAIDGATVTVDLGSLNSTHDNFNIIVNQQ